ncbi:D-glycero-alpha-D-manno-heptose 1-phosphate guanylyltransferase (EC [Olavius algarvensis associated proteobacterium Delta 3]|nr:D-glycero-alpha-D-manno-heptose 1-phosphate guanylyltransferase (EC [Olavius algarvensis associated proteobacterium Delta 3]
MTDWKSVLINPSSSILDAMRIIDQGGLQIGLVADGEGHLIGTLTDGDIRRAILGDLSLELPVETIMSRHPVTVGPNLSKNQIIALMRREDLRQIPVVDDRGHLVDLKILIRLLETGHRDNLVLLMAGGTGNRLRPLTEECPKPLLKVGGKPILETLIQNFKKQGFTNFYISTHYKAEMIESYFGSGEDHGVTIHYIREKEQLGTAGALSLLTAPADEPIIVMNGDVLTNVDFNRVLDFHLEAGATATMCVRKYEFQVPFGVVHIEGDSLKDIKEKPVQSFFVNAGIYALAPEVLSMVPKNQFLYMPDVFSLLMEQEKKVVTFPLHEYWMDIGQKSDFDQANGDFSDIFS